MQKPGNYINHLVESFSERVSEIDMIIRKINVNYANNPSQVMNISISIRPNVFYSSIVIEAKCQQNTHTIVHITNRNGKIVKMFGWYLLNGANITTIHDLEPGQLHDMLIVISDNLGNVLFESDLIPA